MLERHARYMPVMDKRMLMGVISFYDVAKAVVDSQNFENKMLKAYIRDWPEEEELAPRSPAKPDPRCFTNGPGCAGRALLFDVRGLHDLLVARVLGLHEPAEFLRRAAARQRALLRAAWRAPRGPSAPR